ncbi:ribose ABC transporter permease [Rhizobium sp. P44RR-XXIV]|uniref:ABC transporter permease subunit n=1 Tax=Rhizobium sp. P44RR-XXIV TaxID=1921145 RepID=UPI00197CF718|nr:ribose ABC transporter permease [Rhizobium sp. P44RR-XXIV]
MGRLEKFWETYGTLCILIVILVLFSILSPAYFLRKDNLVQIVLQSSITILLALGEFFPILIAGIDLSVGSILALAGIVTGKLLLMGFDPWLAVLIGGAGVGILLGAINGLLVNFTGLHPFIITLGTNAIFRGVTLIISGATPVFGFPYAFTDALTGSLFYVPVPIIVALAMALILWWMTRQTRLGRNIYAVGGNKEAAFFSGIDVKFHTLMVFMISGLCAGLAGVLSTPASARRSLLREPGSRPSPSPRPSSGERASLVAKGEFPPSSSAASSSARSATDSIFCVFRLSTSWWSWVA